MKTITELKIAIQTVEDVLDGQDKNEVFYNVDVVNEVDRDVQIINENIQKIQKIKDDVLCDKNDLKLVFSCYDYKNYGIQADYVEPRKQPKRYRDEDDVICYYTKETIIKGLKEKRKAKIRKLFSCGGYNVETMIASRQKKVNQLEKEIIGLKNQEEYAYALLNKYGY